MSNKVDVYVNVKTSIAVAIVSTIMIIPTMSATTLTINDLMRARLPLANLLSFRNSFAYKG